MTEFRYGIERDPKLKRHLKHKTTVESSHHTRVIASTIPETNSIDDTRDKMRLIASMEPPPAAADFRKPPSHKQANPVIS